MCYEYCERQQGEKERWKSLIAIRPLVTAVVVKTTEKQPSKFSLGNKKKYSGKNEKISSVKMNFMMKRKFFLRKKTRSNKKLSKRKQECLVLKFSLPTLNFFHHKKSLIEFLTSIIHFFNKKKSFLKRF